MQWRRLKRVSVKGGRWGNKTRKLTETELEQLREIYIALKLSTAKKNMMNVRTSRLLKKAKTKRQRYAVDSALIELMRGATKWR